MFTPKLPDLKDHCKYLSPSSTRKIYWKGFYLSKPLTNGNSKLGKDVLSFDLLAIRTCPNCKDCRKPCFAAKMERFRPVVHDKHCLNTALAVHDLPTLVDMIVDQLKRTKKRIVRIHSSGDFFRQDYVDAWVFIARMFPNINFYGYTKTRKIFDFRGADLLHNLNIVDSLLPDGSINFGNDEYLASKKETFPTIPICPVTLGKDTECMRGCTKCLGCRYVMFKQH